MKPTVAHFKSSRVRILHPHERVGRSHRRTISRIRADYRLFMGWD